MPALTALFLSVAHIGDEMTTIRAKSDFWRGTRDGSPFLLVIVPFAVLFGVVGTEAGLPLAQVMGFSILVIAGAAQFTALQLMSEEAPVLIVIASALAVNLRMAMYSASLTPYLGQAKIWQRALVAYLCVDQSFAISHAQYESRPEMTISQRLAYFAGAIWIIAPVWYLCTFIGALVGEAIPEAWALDFAVPICFLAIIGPSLRTPAHVAAALVSVAGALLLVWVPYNLGLMIAALFAMMAGAEVERRMTRA